MLHNKRVKIIVSLIAVLSVVLMLAACAAKADPEEEANQTKEQTTEERTAEDKTAEEQTTGENTEKETETAESVKVIDKIDTDDMNDVPLQIESITLYDDGTVAIVPTDDLLRNAETNNEIRDGAMHPFDDSGKVKDIYLVRYGNGGFRTIICLMDDGSLSAMSAKELINDRIAIVWDNLTGRDTYVSIENYNGGDAWGVKGITEDGEEVDLDFSLDF